MAKKASVYMLRVTRGDLGALGAVGEWYLETKYVHANDPGRVCSTWSAGDAASWTTKSEAADERREIRKLGIHAKIVRFEEVA